MARAAKTHSIKTMIVEGRGPFPIDMLRYDSCWPASEEDSNRIRMLCDPDLRHAEEKRRQEAGHLPGLPTQVELKSVAHYEPTYRRWESFGWKVKGTEGFPL